MSVENLELPDEDFNDENSEDKDEEELHREKIARDIAQKGDYDAILEELEEKDLLYEQIERLQGVVSIEFLTENDWKMLAVMELYDKGTFEHCVKTYLIAKEKVEKMLGDQIVIADLIKNEGMELEVFYRACLFHDIGKVEIPSFVLHNSLTDSEWMNNLCQIVYGKDSDNHIKQILFDEINMPQESFPKEDDLKTSLIKKHIRAMRFVPMKNVLSEKEILALEEKGFSSKMSLKQIMEAHEEISKRILNDAGLPVEAKLAGQHHNYKHKKTDQLKIPISTTSLSISLKLSDVIHLADVQQALEQRRSYKIDQHRTRALVELVRQSQDGFIDEYITYLWVCDDMKNISPEELKNENIRADVEDINLFLTNYKNI